MTNLPYKRIYEPNWVPFWWESNFIWGMINGPDDWLKVVEAYNQEPIVKLGDAKEAPSGHGRNEAKVPKFGFRIECNGDLTLKDWADANKMTLERVN